MMKPNGQSVVLIRMDREPSSHADHPRHPHPPLDLKYIQSAICQMTGEEVPLIDGWLRRCPLSQITAEALSFNPRMAVVKAVTWCMDEAIRVGKALREAGVITIAVGQQVSHLAKSDHPEWREAFDLPILGEPEEEVPRVIRRLLDGERVADIALRHLDRMRTNEPFLVEAPDRMPQPSFSRKELADYAFPFPVPSRKVPHRWGYLLTSWGCPRKCRHCSEVVRKTVGTRLRKRDPADVADEIESLLQMGAEAICFEDDSLFCDRRHFLHICEEMARRGLSVPWMAHARPDELDEERVAAAADTGAVLLKIGVESGSPTVIESIGKSPSGRAWIEQVETGFSRLRQHHVSSVALFMVGSPYETYSDIEQSVALAKKIKPDYIQVQIFCAYPDSPFFDQLTPESETSGMYHYLRPTHSLSRMPPDTLPSVQSKFYKDFYLRPEYVAHHVRRFWRFYTDRRTVQASFSLLSRLARYSWNI